VISRFCALARMAKGAQAAAALLSPPTPCIPALAQCCQLRTHRRGSPTSAKGRPLRIRSPQAARGPLYTCPAAPAGSLRARADDLAARP